MQKLIKIYLSVFLSLFIYSCNEMQTSRENQLRLTQSDRETSERAKSNFEEALEATKALQFNIKQTLAKDDPFQILANQLVSHLGSLLNEPSGDLNNFKEVIGILDELEEGTHDLAFNEKSLKSLKERIEFLIFNFPKKKYQVASFLNSSICQKIRSKEEFTQSHKKAPLVIFYNGLNHVLDLIKDGKLKKANRKMNFYRILCKNSIEKELKSMQLNLIQEIRAFLEELDCSIGSSAESLLSEEEEEEKEEEVVFEYEGLKKWIEEVNCATSSNQLKNLF